MLDKLKDQVAKESGYSSWEEMYNWIAREGEKPEVVAQLIESAMERVISILLTPTQ